MFFHLLEEIRREWCRLLHTHKFIWTKTCKQCGRLKPLLSSTSGAQEMWKSVGASDGHREREGVNRRNIERRVQEQRKKRSWNVLKFDDDTVILYETTWLQYDSILVRRIVPNLKDWGEGKAGGLRFRSWGRWRGVCAWSSTTCSEEATGLEQLRIDSSYELILANFIILSSSFHRHSHPLNFEWFPLLWSFLLSHEPKLSPCPLCARWTCKILNLILVMFEIAEEIQLPGCWWGVLCQASAKQSSAFKIMTSSSIKQGDSISNKKSGWWQASFINIINLSSVPPRDILSIGPVYHSK